MKKNTIIVAGGKGQRMGRDLPKQFIVIGGEPILMHTLRRFYEVVRDDIFVVLPKEHIDYWDTLCSEYHFDIPHRVVEGGSTRFYSVKKGLDAIVNTEGCVAIHDGVRPFPSCELIENAFLTAFQTGSAVPVFPVTDSMRCISSEGSEIVDRSKYCIVQTPQVFNLELLKRAYEQPFNEMFTDDASVFEAAGGKVTLINGNRENIKLTHPADLLWAEIYLKQF